MKKLLSILICVLIFFFAGCAKIEMLSSAGQKKHFLAQESEKLGQISESISDEITAIQGETDDIIEEIQTLQEASEQLIDKKSDIKKEYDTLLKEYNTKLGTGLDVTYGEFIMQFRYASFAYEDYYNVYTDMDYTWDFDSDGNIVKEYIVSQTDQGDVLLKYSITLTNDGKYVKEIIFYANTKLGDEETGNLLQAYIGSATVALLCAKYSPYEYSDEMDSIFDALILTYETPEKDIQYTQDSYGDMYIVRIQPGPNSSENDGI